mgnify:CR=1 FL=1
MKIAVLVKQVPGSESVLPISSEQTWIDEDMVSFVMNPPDNFALEEALLIREMKGNGKVVVVSMGPARVQKVIREGLAKGADRGIHLEEDGRIETDPLSIAKRFSSVLKDKYKIFTKEYDEVKEAEDLENESEITRLRKNLDQQLTNLQNIVAKLANKLQRKLLAKQNRSWEFDLEEGMLDCLLYTSPSPRDRG